MQGRVCTRTVPEASKVLFNLCTCTSQQSDMPQPNLCTTIEEYNASLHAFARTGLINLMESKRQCLAFQRNHLLNPTAAVHLHENLVGELQEYLGEVRLQLPLPRVLQVGGEREQDNQYPENIVVFPYKCSGICVAIGKPVLLRQLIL